MKLTLQPLNNLSQSLTVMTPWCNICMSTVQIPNIRVYKKKISLSTLPFISVVCETDHRHCGDSFVRTWVFRPGSRKISENSWKWASLVSSVSHPIACNIQSQQPYFILSHKVTQAFFSCVNVPSKLSILSPVCSHKVRLIQRPHAYMTEVGLGRIQALGPKWVAGYGPCRKWALLWGGKTRGVKTLSLHVPGSRAVPVAWQTSWQPTVQTS